MVCIAAFIIFLIIWLFTPLMKLFGFKKQANNINKMFKKSIYCFTRRATFRACDSNFKDEIKNSILKKLIVKHKKWVKPVSWGIEISALLIVIITIWSLLTVVKSSLSLYAFGTCDVKKPEACALNSAEACSIDGSGSGNPVVDWFDEWKEVINAIPGRMRNWNANDFIPKNGSYYNQYENKEDNLPTAVDIFDPGCIVCRRSFVNQKQSNFFTKHKTYLIPYVISGEKGDKFANSNLIAHYIEAVRGTQPENGKKIAVEWEIAERIFTHKDDNKSVWQDNFNSNSGKKMSEAQVTKKLNEWMKELGYSQKQIEDIAIKLKSKEVEQKILDNRNMVEKNIQTKKIPTMIFNGQRHDGIYKLEN